jgi:hypothetical protein
MTGVRSPAEAKDSFSSPSVQNTSEAHPASYTMGTGGPFPGVEGGQGVTLTTHPYLVPKSRMSRGYTSSLHWCLNGVAALLYFTLLTFVSDCYERIEITDV